jgi:hypothetical protein
MKMRHKDGRKGSWTSEGGSKAHNDSTTGIAQNDLIARAHER